MKTCRIDGCNKPSHKKDTSCCMHRSRINKYGDPSIVKRKGRPEVKLPTYVTVHSRLTRIKGKASNYSCDACGSQAVHWAYQGGCPNEVKNPKTGSPYSADLEKYLPMCRRCHVLLDYSRDEVFHVLEYLNKSKPIAGQLAVTQQTN